MKSAGKRITPHICAGLAVIAGSSGFLGLISTHGNTAENAVPTAAHTSSPAIGAVGSETFLSSLGVVTHADQGFSPSSYIAPLRYLGVHNIREGAGSVTGCILMHQEAGIRVNLVGADVGALIAAAKNLAAADALLSLEGPNEPNNFQITYNGRRGGGTSTWVPVAELQRDLYKAVKSDPALERYPVFSVSEAGAETDNVGLQFLTIPQGAGTLLPDGTQYADYANPHNYVSGNSGRYEDNQAWQAADPILNSHWDGLYGEYGRTWKQGFQGYSEAQLQTLPRVTTETGWDSISNPGGEKVQGVVLVNTYLAQFKRGWRYTFIYNLRDNEGGTSNQGLFHVDWTPKLAATYIHNLTSILSDGTTVRDPGKLNYSIANEPATVHDLLLQKGSGLFALIVWNEQIAATSDIVVNLGGNHRTVRVYDVTTGTSPIQSLSNVTNVPLKLSDHALIIETD